MSRRLFGTAPRGIRGAASEDHYQSRGGVGAGRSKGARKLSVLMTSVPGDIWNERREQHEAAVIKAAIELLEFMGDAGAFRLDLGTLITIVAGLGNTYQAARDQRVTPISAANTDGRDPRRQRQLG